MTPGELARELGDGLRVNDPESIVRFWFEGFGIDPTPEQIEARIAVGQPGPRQPREKKFTWLSGGQRAGKTVELFIWHAESCLYKVGVDTTDKRYWDNFGYRTLHSAPTDDLSLKMWVPAEEISKRASEAQRDKVRNLVRPSVFTSLFSAGKERDWGIVRFKNGSAINLRSTEGKAKRLEGSAWWFITWDEWASQNDSEIDYVLTSVLTGRARDYDAKIVPAAWPKPETERHLIAVIRKIEKGLMPDSQVRYLSAENAHFTNKAALDVERSKDEATWKRTVLGQPAGGSGIEFPLDVLENMVDDKARWPIYPLELEGYRFFQSWDVGMAHDATVGITWAIPLAGVSPMTKARIVNFRYLPGGESVTIDLIAYEIMALQAMYRGETALDASAMGGLSVSRALSSMKPSPLNFVARSNDRIHGNMRLASIANALDCLTWGRPADETLEGPVAPWGLVEAPRIPELIDQLASFDRDAKNVADDCVSAFNIGLWYIKRYFVVARAAYRPVSFDVRTEGPTTRDRRKTVDMRV